MATTSAAMKQKKADPFGPKPERCPLIDWMSLFEIAYSIGHVLETPLTVYKVSGAIRALGLRNNDQRYMGAVKGCVIYRQQTMVHKSQLKAIQKYLEERLE